MFTLNYQQKLRALVHTTTLKYQRKIRATEELDLVSVAAQVS